MAWMNMTRGPAMPEASAALPGRDTAMPVPDRHAVLGSPLSPPYPQNARQALFGMGCFWGVERLFWQLEGVYTTAVGYAAGLTPNPTYREVCTGQTGHNEVVRVVYHAHQVSYEALLTAFWENHDPTQGMRQGNDVGTQYRSGIYYSDDAQHEARVLLRRGLSSAVPAQESHGLLRHGWHWCGVLSGYGGVVRL